MDFAFDSESKGNLQWGLWIFRYTNTQTEVYLCKSTAPSKKACNQQFCYEEPSVGYDVQR
jgi:hypothetical protein